MTRFTPSRMSFVRVLHAIKNISNMKCLRIVDVEFVSHNLNIYNTATAMGKINCYNKKYAREEMDTLVFYVLLRRRFCCTL